MKGFFSYDVGKNKIKINKSKNYPHLKPILLLTDFPHGGIGIKNQPEKIPADQDK